MDDFLRRMKVKDLLREALEHSAYFAPNDFGLPRDACRQAARRPIFPSRGKRRFLQVDTYNVDRVDSFSYGDPRTPRGKVFGG